ncbi:uncharacterized protein LOC142589688 isoform X2 [Dermacentor variabilis]|uniref:uncharacterized protein LOC142589688 isoform X2 n=1 Tax=Dermacentor variabilis TaxID=34621 RepID=UPI003F5C6E54
MGSASHFCGEACMEALRRGYSTQGVDFCKCAYGTLCSSGILGRPVGALEIRMQRAAAIASVLMHELPRLTPTTPSAVAANKFRVASSAVFCFVRVFPRTNCKGQQSSCRRHVQLTSEVKLVQPSDRDATLRDNGATVIAAWLRHLTDEDRRRITGLISRASAVGSRLAVGGNCKPSRRSWLATRKLEGKKEMTSCTRRLKNAGGDHVSKDLVLAAECKPYETFGCGGADPYCGENRCGAGPEPAGLNCNLTCIKGCWCTGNLYRRPKDNLCVTSNEC